MSALIRRLRHQVIWEEECYLPPGTCDAPGSGPAGVRGAMGFTFQRMYATNVASARRTAVVAAAQLPATVCRMVALTITIISPAAAPDTSHGWIRVMPGRVMPIAADPRRRQVESERRRNRGVHLFDHLGWRIKKSTPCAKNATAKTFAAPTTRCSWFSSSARDARGTREPMRLSLTSSFLMPQHELARRIEEPGHPDLDLRRRRHHEALTICGAVSDHASPPSP